MKILTYNFNFNIITRGPLSLWSISTKGVDEGAAMKGRREEGREGGIEVGGMEGGIEVGGWEG